MIHVDKNHVAVTGSATTVLADLTMVINSVVNSMARRGENKDDLKPVFYHVVDMAFGLGTSTEGTTIDLSYKRSEP